MAWCPKCGEAYLTNWGHSCKTVPAEGGSVYPAGDTRAAESPVNLPFNRVPCCACDPGIGPAPTKQKMMECKIRGGPCSPKYRPQIPETN